MVLLGCEMPMSATIALLAGIALIAAGVGRIIYKRTRK